MIALGLGVFIERRLVLSDRYREYMFAVGSGSLAGSIMGLLVMGAATAGFAENAVLGWMLLVGSLETMLSITLVSFAGAGLSHLRRLDTQRLEQ